jgi:D-3-phosphoglycerate dehydrogenase
MGSMSSDCRLKMEIEATEEVVRFIQGKDLYSEVPEMEYDFQKYEL